MQKRFHSLCLLSAALFLVTAIGGNAAQTSTFKYHGFIRSGGTPANGNYDLQFRLYDSLTAGNQIGTPLLFSAVPVSNGVFSVPLDFGSAAFPGADRYLEVTITPTGSGTPTTLDREQIFSSPYATTAANASNAAHAVIADSAASATTASSTSTLNVPATASGSDATAAVAVTNSAPGVANPSYSNPGPAAVRGEATDTTNTNVGVIGIADGAAGLGVLGLASGTPGGCSPTPCDSPEVDAVLGSASSTSGKTRGVHGEVFSPDGVGVYAQNNASMGNIYEGWNDSALAFEVTHTGNVVANKFALFNGNFFVNSVGAMVAASVDTNEVFSNNIAPDSGDIVSIIGNLSVNGNLGVSGTKNAIQKLPDGRSVLVAAVEAPESWFEDFGSGELKEGAVWIPFDKTFAEAANPEMDYHVFLTPAGDCHGLYVSKRSASGFEVRELGKGRSNIQFDYRIVAQRRGFEKRRFEEAHFDAPVVKVKPTSIH